MRSSVLCGSRYALGIALAVSSCLPTSTERESLVSGPRILAVVAEPPEVAPGEKVTYKALVARPDGTAKDAQVAWEYCVAPKPLWL